jgi:hypothetical protein
MKERIVAATKEEASGNLFVHCGNAAEDVRPQNYHQAFSDNNNV